MRSPFSRLLTAAPLALGASLCVAAGALAETQDEIVAQMQKQGFKSIEVSTTWLRRVRIVGEGQPGAREVVLDPRNGEVLRDFTAPSRGTPEGQGFVPPPSGSLGSPDHGPSGRPGFGGPAGPGDHPHPGGPPGPGGPEGRGGPGGPDGPGGHGGPGGPGGLGGGDRPDAPDRPSPPGEGGT